MKVFRWLLKRVGAKDQSRDLAMGLRMAGLDEETLRRMEPDDRVAALEKANLDPYDYIYLSC